jgi:hypothetical protein
LNPYTINGERVGGTGLIRMASSGSSVTPGSDLSRFGAGLVVDEAVSLPTEIDLTFDHATRRYVTVWRQGHRMGVKLKPSLVAWRR